MKILKQFDTDKSFFFENGFYLASRPDRLGKLLAHYELYKMIRELPGAILECGVFKGASLVRFATFRNLFESPYARKVIGFDTFGSFPKTRHQDDKSYRQKFIDAAGEKSISETELLELFHYKGIENVELVKGDITHTLPAYLKKNPHLKIALLHIDTDVYEPAKVILEHAYERVVRGGIVAFDDYGTFPGETKAVDEFFQDMPMSIKKFPFSHIPSYLIKK